jgi:hypothetical protein
MHDADRAEHACSGWETRCPGLGPGLRVAVASNIECPRCGVFSSDVVRGVCRTCYMRGYGQRRSVSPVTVTHDTYGGHLCMPCREPGLYARAWPLRKMLHAGLSAPSSDALHLCLLWRLVSVVTKRHALLLAVLPTARTLYWSVCEGRSVRRRPPGATPTRRPGKRRVGDGAGGAALVAPLVFRIVAGSWATASHRSGRRKLPRPRTWGNKAPRSRCHRSAMSRFDFFARRACALSQHVRKPVKWRRCEDTVERACFLDCAR